MKQIAHSRVAYPTDGARFGRCVQSRLPGITTCDAGSDRRPGALRASVVRRYDLDPLGQQIAGRRLAHVPQAEDADHTLALVDHWQAAHLELLHVPNRLGEIVVVPAAM